MSARHHVTLFCDEEGCQIWTGGDVNTAVEARRDAKLIGWRYARGGWDFCPKHSGVSRRETER
jgi:hypothetical protein